MLTVLVPITDADAVVVNELPPVDSENINVIYKYDGVYKRVQKNAQGVYVYMDVVDREFPQLGKPLEIFDFTYDATRMGVAPMISASKVMWFAGKDNNGNDVTLEDMWAQECHVRFDGENYYLKQIPTSSKSHEDARYSYDLDFVSERVVLEQVYLYDVVQPFITERPISESSKFSFYGDISELVKRINASLLKSGLAKLRYRQNVDWVLLTSGPSDWHTNWQNYYALQNGEYVKLSEIFTMTSPVFAANVYYKFGHARFLSDNETLAANDQFFTYAEWCSINQGTYNGQLSTKDVYLGVTEEVTAGQKAHTTIFDHYGGDYNAYLRNEVFLLDEYGEPIMDGYICRLGKDSKGNITTSEEKLVVFEDNYIHDALQQVKDTFDLQYYISSEKDSDGVLTGNTIIMIADCEHDFADVDGDDFVRDADGLPTTEHPFDYGVEGALLSKEKTNTTDKIVTRITGVGSTENIPWYYPNPTADGWIKPVYKRNGEVQEVDIDYPTSEGVTVADNVRYERYLKNRLGDTFQFGKKIISVSNYNIIDEYSSYKTSVDENGVVLCYGFQISEQTRIYSNGFACTFEGSSVSYLLFKDDIDITDSSNAFLNTGGVGNLATGNYVIIFTITFADGGPSVSEDVQYYFYPQKSGWCSPWKTWSARMILNILTGIFSLSAIRTFIGSFTGFNADMPAFLSTNPNLTFIDDDDATILGWYDGNRRIGKTEMIFGEKNAEYYVFLGGNGQQSVGTDNVYLANFDKTCETTNLQLLNVNPYDWDESRQFFGAWSYGDAGREYASSGEPIEVDIEIESFINNYISYSFDGYIVDGWYKNNKKQDLSDFGILGETVLTNGADVTDTIEFQRVKYVTPQPNLMPEVYIKTDGERRFYKAHNYYPLQVGTLDPMIGEERPQNSSTKVKNDIYKANETDAESKHYHFENEFVSNLPKEHIENFDDVKPTIKEQTNTITINGVETTFRVDVVEEFAFDELDNDEIWEDDTENSGEYKHPFFFAKLRPLGFNLFDMALQEDMVLSMTTGHCGACNFRIGVDERTKKNPVQIWKYDVYSGDTYATKGEKLYSAGDLRRYVDDSHFYYDMDGTEEGYVPVNSNVVRISRESFLVNGGQIDNNTSFMRTVYPASMVINGEVGSLKQDNRSHSVGDVTVNGRFIESQQDTSENYVWVALYKDIDTYGTIMPSAQPDYGDGNYSRYIEPKGHIYHNRKTGETDILSDDDADKFVLVNIKMPQIYLRRAERVLSRKLVQYMYEHNYQMFNFSINFSRIFLAQNLDIESHLNENSVLYVSFNNRIYRQYVNHYSYKMTKDAVLPEISVDMNEELSVSRTQTERTNNRFRSVIIDAVNHTTAAVREATTRLSRGMIGRNDDVVVSGSIISRDAVASIADVNRSANISMQRISDNRITMSRNFAKTAGFVEAVNTFNAGVDSHLKQLRKTIETRVLPTLSGVEENDSCIGANKYYFTPTLQADNQVALFWLSPNGSEQMTTEGLCPTNQGMTDISWDNYDISY